MANSLKARAISLLAGREHSRVELRRKLLRRAAPLSAPRADPADAADPIDPATLAREVDALLDWLEAHDYLSAARFVESRVNARSARHGTERIRQELGRHAVELPADTLRTLHESEYDRARSVWLRKFREPAPDAAGRARQARFLASRGFTAPVIVRLIRGLDPDD